VGKALIDACRDGNIEMALPREKGADNARTMLASQLYTGHVLRATHCSDRCGPHKQGIDSNARTMLASQLYTGHVLSLTLGRHGSPRQGGADIGHKDSAYTALHLACMF
jgi:hypothetical protein